MRLDGIVSQAEIAMTNLSDGQTLYIAAGDVRALIADWRKRGEALEAIRDADQVEMSLDPAWPSRIASAALTTP